ncbi:MAG: hypothetical protein AUJ86_07110 [Hydrogenophilaceae bacterium CG1_02_62_390]|nr:MAG: hypothetical protein AUJ86_07110 [Hydrogenophilaceae bacterium CG1_02_62_390]
MAIKIRYGDYLGLARTHHRVISYNAITSWDASHRRRPHLRSRDIYRLLAPYVGARALEQARAVLPVVLFLVVFQYLLFQGRIAGGAAILSGILAVMLGLMLFMEGLKHGFMPLSENIGHLLPVRATFSGVLTVAFILGAVATFAEPAIGALKMAGSLADPAQAPILYQMLNGQTDAVVLTVAASVGLAVLVSAVRFIEGWPFKPVVIIVTLSCLALTAYMTADPALAPIVGLAWDTGAITTGPVTVPMVVALGVGVSAAVGRGGNPLSGFGIVTLASLFPPIGVMLLGIHTAALGEPLPVAAAIGTALATEAGITDHILAALRAIVPLVLILWLIQRFWLREPTRHPDFMAYGVGLAIVGMVAFYVGLGTGLTPLGIQSGNMLSTVLDNGGALYPAGVGLAVALLFALALGFGATLAEPALNALGLTVQTLTDGAFQKSTLIYAVAIGVGLGTALGVLKIIFHIPLAWLLIPAYLLALVMTWLAREEHVNLAWDSAGVTTGPVTVPLVLAMGLGLGQASGARDGFGILAMASVGPIVSVLAVGLWLQTRDRLMRIDLFGHSQ